MIFKSKTPKEFPKPNEPPKTNGVCVHDWEEIDYYSWTELLREVVYEDASDLGTNPHSYLSFNYRGFIFFGRRPKFMCAEYPKQKVCLKCGQCFNGVKEARKRILTWLNAWADTQQDKKDRKELAKKLWKDRGCDHADG